MKKITHTQPKVDYDNVALGRKVEKCDKKRERKKEHSESVVELATAILLEHDVESFDDLQAKSSDCKEWQNISSVNLKTGVIKLENGSDFGLFAYKAGGIIFEKKNKL